MDRKWGRNDETYYHQPKKIEKKPHKIMTHPLRWRKNLPVFGTRANACFCLLMQASTKKMEENWATFSPLFFVHVLVQFSTVNACRSKKEEKITIGNCTKVKKWPTLLLSFVDWCGTKCTAQFFGEKRWGGNASCVNVCCALACISMHLHVLMTRRRTCQL